MKKLFSVLAIICAMAFVASLTSWTMKNISFETNCHAYIHRAAGANNIETAKVELAKAIEYAEDNNLTEGIVYVFIKSPRNDIGFWYNTLKSIYKELDTFPEDATQLEISNYFMSMREGLFEVGLPDGISIYPNNVLYSWWFILSLIGMLVFLFLAYFVY